MRQIEIFRFWLPLFASWLLMTAEGPLISSVVNRLPDEVVMLAAFGIVISLAILIESPIINLLATATALVHDRSSFVQVRRFTVHWIVVLTAISAAMAFTPLFDWVVLRAMAVPPEIGRWVRPGLGILVLWTAAIAWRRFLQGVMIRFGRTRLIGWGTALRLTTVVITIGGLAWWGRWPGIYVASTALMVGVLTEALYATLMIRPILRQELAPTEEPSPSSTASPQSESIPQSGSMPSSGGGDGEPLTYRMLFSYHLPLAGTSVLTLLVQPMVTFSLARLDQPTLSLAAWPVVFHALMMMRAMALALPEVVIALSRESANYQALRRFSLSLAGISLAGMAFLALTPLADFYLVDLQSTTAAIADLSRRGFLHFLPMPALVALISWQRGLLMGRRQTGLINAGMAVRLLVFAVALAIGVASEQPGIATAAWSINVSVLAEWAFLGWRMRAANDGLVPRKHS